MLRHRAKHSSDVRCSYLLCLLNSITCASLLLSEDRISLQLCEERIPFMHSHGGHFVSFCFLPVCKKLPSSELLVQNPSHSSLTRGQACSANHSHANRGGTFEVTSAHTLVMFVELTKLYGQCVSVCEFPRYADTHTYTFTNDTPCNGTNGTSNVPIPRCHPGGHVSHPSPSLSHHRLETDNCPSTCPWMGTETTDDSPQM